MRGCRALVVPAMLALALLAGGCGTAPAQPSKVLRTGFDTLDGTLAVWPARGALVRDTAAIDAVSRAVAGWHTPAGDSAYLPASGILWLGDAAGVRLALVAAMVPGNGASWLVQLTGQGDGFTIDRAAEYPDPGYLVYTDVLPVPLPDGRRYLASARVERLTGPTGERVPVTDGLSAPVPVPPCAPVPVTAALRPTESLPQGKTADRVIDLGTGITAPRYPLVGDDADTARKALKGLDTCALGTDAGPFGSVERHIAGQEAPTSMPASWPIDRITSRSLGDVALGPGPLAKLEQISWRTDSGVMTGVVLRPPSGVATFSGADRFNPLQCYEVSRDGTAYVVLVWQAAPDVSLSVPTEIPRLVDRPGLVIVPKPADRQTFSLLTPDKAYYRSVNE